MWLAEDAPIRKQDLYLEKPFVNAAGMLGFSPDPRSMPFLGRLGAFITNPVSRRPRQVAGARCCLPFPGGFLLHTGLPNPGISAVIRQNHRRWAAAPLPVIVHLLVKEPGSLAEMIRKLEGLENILGVELGLPPDCTPNQLRDFLSAAEGELPAALCLGPEQIPVLLPALKELNPIALHLTQPRGALPGPNGELVSGRLYGPAVFPVMLNVAREVVTTGIPMIVDGGVVEQGQVDSLLEMGILAVGLGSTLWGIKHNL
jgi:dihydroorotate dehydrogenase (NAD+) catalytic subunit